MASCFSLDHRHTLHSSPRQASSQTLSHLSISASKSVTLCVRECESLCARVSSVCARPLPLTRHTHPGRVPHVRRLVHIHIQSRQAIEGPGFGLALVGWGGGRSTRDRNVRVSDSSRLHS